MKKESLKERVLKNEKNCRDGAMQILYSITQYGGLEEPFASWVNGAPIPNDSEDPQVRRFELMIEDIADSILLFNDEITEGGEILV